MQIKKRLIPLVHVIFNSAINLILPFISACWTYTVIVKPKLRDSLCNFARKRYNDGTRAIDYHRGPCKLSGRAY